MFLGGGLSSPTIMGIRIEFILFALTLAGIVLFDNKTMYVALAGMLSIIVARYLFSPGFSLGEHFFGTSSQAGEWSLLLNLMGLLLGFTILTKYFEESKLPELLPRFLPDGWKGALLLLFFIMFISAFLDNIAAAMIGGTIAMTIYKGKVHIGYLAAIVAASNAGGAGSVLGDTTTTMLWIGGVKPLILLSGFIASAGAFLVFGLIASWQQGRFQPIDRSPVKGVVIDQVSIGIVILILISAIAANQFWGFPALGVWMAILIGTIARKVSWAEIPKVMKGTIFLLALLFAASLMPVNELPAATLRGTFIIGLVSAVFDNIPLTKLCLDQGGYDWGLLAYAVGFGGSMLWFGSSAGVALSGMFPETRSVYQYLKNGWHVTVAYVVGFSLFIGIAGWHPTPIEPFTSTEGQQDLSLRKESVQTLLPLDPRVYYSLYTLRTK